MDADLQQQMQVHLNRFVKREQSWRVHDRRGRWVVIEPGAGRHLTGCPASVRMLADALSHRRGRRFSSLARARLFAKQVNGRVARWRRVPPGGGRWKLESPWERALRSATTSLWLAPAAALAACGGEI